MASSLTQNAAATSLAPPRGIRFLKIHVFARGYYKEKYMCPCTGHLEGRTGHPGAPHCDAVKLLIFDS